MSEIERLSVNVDDKIIEYIFYDGINVDYVLKYVGEEILVIYVDSWKDVEKKVNRSNNINKILGDSLISTDDISKRNNVMIYQTSGFIGPVHSTILSRFKRNSSNIEIVPVFGIKKV